MSFATLARRSLLLAATATLLAPTAFAQKQGCPPITPFLQSAFSWTRG